MGHWEYDIAADRYTFNDFFYALFKTSVQHVGGYTMSEEEYSRRFVHPEDVGFMRDEVKKALETKDPYYEREIEHRVICADGSIGYASVRFFVVMNENGRPIKTYGVSQDITERKKAERQIQLLASTLGSTQDCVSVTDMDDKIIYVNDSFLQTYGYSADELIGQHVSVLRSPLTPVEVIQELLPASLVGGWAGELMNRRKDGTDFPIELWTSVVRDRNGANVAMVGVARDITGRKRAEEALRQSEERLRMLIEGSDDIMVMQDLDGRYLHYSSAKHYAIAPESVVGKLPSDIHEPLTAAMLTERHKRVIATGQSVTQDDSIQWRGEQMWFSSQVSPVYDATGAIIATVSISHNITKRKRAEEALRRNEELFRNVFNQQFQFMTLLSPEGRVLAVNDLALEVSNLKRDEYIGKVFWKTPAWKLKPEWQEIWPARLKQAEKSDHPVLTEDSFLAADGSVRYAHFATSAVRKPDGKPAFFIVQATDITEQRNAETAMHQSEERFRDLVESLKEVVFRTDARGRWRFLNVAWTEVTGFAVDDCLDRDYLDFVHSDDRERSVQAFSPLLEGNVPFTQREIRCLHKDGGFRWVEVRARLTLDDNGNSIGMSGTLSDITERRQAEIALRENEYALRKSQEVGGLGSYVFDARTGHWQSSLMLDRIFGIGDSFNKDVDGWLHFVHPSSRKEMAEYFKTHVLANHNTFDREYRIIRQDDGTERWVHGIGKLEFDDHQNPIRMIGTIRDITDRKLAEEEIMKSNIQLRQLSAHLESVREEERKHISREIHDELGQELTALKMEAVLLQKATSRGDQPEIRAIIRDHATSLSGITDRAIRTVRRIASELRPDVLDKLGLVAALEWHAKEFEKHSQIECAFTSDLNGENIDETVATAIFRIFQEALTNVGRHSGASHVRSELTRKRRNLVLRVADNGRGISEDQILYSKSLGLLGMSERALMLGGKATVQGKDGEGTVVEVEIPIFAED